MSRSDERHEAKLLERKVNRRRRRKKIVAGHARDRTLRGLFEEFRGARMQLEAKYRLDARKRTVAVAIAWARYVEQVGEVWAAWNAEWNAG